MAFEKLLIFESRWSEEIEDTTSSTQIYTSIQSLLSLQDEPIRIITRPLLSKLYLNDIKQFVSLDANKAGPNIIMLSAHGSHKLVKREGRSFNKRTLEGYCNETINISADIARFNNVHGDKLKNTIFILDCCQIGKNVKAFLKASRAYGVIGFSNNVDWIDSAVFMLALLMKFQQDGVFHLKRIRRNTNKQTPKPKRILDDMNRGLYAPLMESLGVEYEFA